MRIFLALAILAGGIIVLDTPASADTARKSRAKPVSTSYAQQRYKDYREQLECERARYEDPTGEFAGYPCWAREMFGRGRRGYDDSFRR